MVDRVTLCATGYRFLHNPRSQGRDGSVGLLFNDSLRVNSIICEQCKTFELMDVRVESNVCLRVFVIYRPPEAT